MTWALSTAPNRTAYTATYTPIMPTTRPAKAPYTAVNRVDRAKYAAQATRNTTTATAANTAPGRSCRGRTVDPIAKRYRVATPRVSATNADGTPMTAIAPAGTWPPMIAPPSANAPSKITTANASTRARARASTYRWWGSPNE